MLIYFQVASLVGGGDKFASPYMVSDNPLQYHVIETCNPVSIKPNDYKRSKLIIVIINIQIKKYLTIKERAYSSLVSTIGSLKQNVFEQYKLQNVFNR